MALVSLLVRIAQSLILLLVSAGSPVESESANPQTQRALVEALRREGLALQGWTWLGRLPSNATRDTLIYVPYTLDPRAPIELVVFMDGYYSFHPPTLGTRHVPGILELLESGRNFVYVAPDVPPTVHGDDPTSNAPYWARRCRSKCSRASRAPGDFVGFHRDVTGLVRRQLRTRGYDRAGLRFELTLIGFSRGGDGIYTAIGQLARSRGRIRLSTVSLRRVIFADAVYAYHWVTSTWKRIRRLPTLIEMSLLLQKGSGDDPGAHNREVATHFLYRHIDRRAHRHLDHTDELCLGRVHVRFLPASHAEIGDRAVYLGPRCHRARRPRGTPLHARR